MDCAGVGVYGVGCDAACGAFDADNGQSLTMTASSGQRVKVTRNTVDFSFSPSGSVGVWLGDDAWAGGASYSPPAGTETAHLSGNSIADVSNSVVIGGGATF